MGAVNPVVPYAIMCNKLPLHHDDGVSWQLVTFIICEMDEPLSADCCVQTTCTQAQNVSAH